MFHCLSGTGADPVCSDLTNTTWYKLKTVIESVMSQLDAQVRFGFTSIYGTNPSAGGMCPALQGMLTNDISPALHNAATISALYDGLAAAPNSAQSGTKVEAPVSAAISTLAQVLAADATPGSKNIVLLTDGQADYCDDSNALCAPDSVVFRLQKAHAAGITTLVLGMQTSLFDLPPGLLQSFANAGAGEATLAPVRANGTTFDFYDQCAAVPGWAADLTESGNPHARGSTLGSYSTAMGPSAPYLPNGANGSELASRLSAALKSCSFDLAGQLQIDPSKLTGAAVAIAGANVSQDATNGWGLASNKKTIVLNGSACATWRMPQSTGITFDFPCGSIIP